MVVITIRGLFVAFSECRPRLLNVLQWEGQSCHGRTVWNKCSSVDNFQNYLSWTDRRNIGHRVPGMLQNMPQHLQLREANPEQCFCLGNASHPDFCHSFIHSFLHFYGNVIEHVFFNGEIFLTWENRDWRNFLERNFK